MIKKILEQVGGTLEVAYALKKHQISIERWKRHGIPPECWQWFIDRGVTVEELHTANQELKKDESNDI